MPKAAKRLTDTAVKTAKPKDHDTDKPKDRVMTDGNGLQLRVRANGSKLWNFNYIHPVTKKRLNMGLGAYPDVKLAQARALADDARSKVAAGMDPKVSREEKAESDRASARSTLEHVTALWFEVKKTKVTADYADDIWRSLLLHVFPKLGKTPIGDLTAPKLIEVMRPVEESGRLETVKRVNQRVNEVMIHAVNSGIIHANPLAAVGSAFKSPEKRNMPTLAPDELPAFLEKLQDASLTLTTKYLIRWQLHTMTRPSEAAGARWDELVEHDDGQIDWVIPAERMKKRKAHTVPLSSEAKRILDKMRPISGEREHIFPSQRNPQTHTNNQTANMAIKRMGYGGKLVSHGLRALASTILNEEGKDPDLIEAALAHVDANQVRSAYNRSNYLERRRELMEWWSQYLNRL
ncbi:integrase [Aliidiomarina minuta]|uniref:Integrase n=1 Tax=Aliidiomarina minuta TaxID=880057 RepID=A0A432W7J8_9GAMM|nr:integrase domain-containing protein [Aliidiomarina minuta]RUO26012.1 integrase [Aliidiomarina minuta]